MRAPAPLAVLLPPTAWLHRGLRVFAGLVLAISLSWVCRHAGGSDALAFGLAAAAVLSGVVAALRMVPSPAALVTWSGERWALDGQVGSFDVSIDLGGWMLLRFRPASAPRAPWRHGWLDAAKIAPAADWAMFRAALFATSGRALPEPAGGVLS